MIQSKEIKSGRICIVLSGREEDVLKARALLKRNCQPQVELLSKSDTSDSSSTANNDTSIRNEKKQCNFFRRESGP